jgi:16S rRNA processing protein RimM
VLVHESLGEVVVESCRRHHARLLVRFSGVGDRSGAESLRGVLYVGVDRLRTLEPGEYWEHEIVGSVVTDAAGHELGEVTKLVPGSAQDLLEVATPRGVRLVPFVGEIVVEVDVGAGRIRVDPPAGLLD